MPLVVLQSNYENLIKFQEKNNLSRRLRNSTRQVKRLRQKPKQRKLDDKQVLEYLHVKKNSAVLS